VNDELGKRFGGSWLGGYGVRPVRGGKAWSSHSFGASFDRRWEDDTVRAAVMRWLVEHHVALGVQQVHDYFGCRIWRANRYPGQPAESWWRPQQPSAATGMGQTWARYLHIETDRANWSNATPVANRLAPTPTPPAVLFDPERGVWGLYPLNTAKATVRRVDNRPVTPEVHELVRYLQGVLRLRAAQPITVDGDFGPATETAVRNVQAFFRLAVDGVVGSRTWQVIDMLASR
jgi:hypothetical protein